MTVEVWGIEEFERNIEKFRDYTKDQFKQLIVKIGVELLKGVVMMTPVDKGRARGNWQVEINSATDKVLETVDKMGGNTIEKGLAVLQTLKNNGIGQVIYMCNNVEYIIGLEEGTSQQAPHGMVAVTLARLNQMFG